MNTRDLEAAIARVGIPKRDLAEKLGLSPQALYNKINGVSEFKQSEIKLLSNVLSLSIQEVDHIFFDG